jgi:hypothetical protein
LIQIKTNAQLGGKGSENDMASSLIAGLAREGAALRDFASAYVRFWSIATGTARQAGGPCPVLVQKRQGAEGAKCFRVCLESGLPNSR